MKLALLTFLFLFLNYSSTADVVLDLYGNPLVSGGDYYLRTARLWPGPGGVFLANDGNNKTCPVDVNIGSCGPAVPGNCLGEAVRLNPLAKIEIIETNILLNITFAQTPSCAQSPEWILVKEEGAWWVGIGGPEDHPGKEIRTGFFIIVRSGADARAGYKLKFCPKHLPHQTCEYLGLHSDANRNLRLALTDSTPRVIYFLKADEGRSAI